MRPSNCVLSHHFQTHWMKMFLVKESGLTRTRYQQLLIWSHQPTFQSCVDSWVWSINIEPSRPHSTSTTSQLEVSMAVGPSPWLNMKAELAQSEVHPLPKVDETLAQLSGVKVFSKLDGFWQILIAKKSRHLTTLITPFGQYCFNKNALWYFKHFMVVGKVWKCSSGFLISPDSIWPLYRVYCVGFSTLLALNSQSVLNWAHF